MEIVRILLLVVEAVCALLLIGVILLQKSKSEGLGVAFGSGMGETLFGSRAGNVLTKITITLGITFLVTTTLLAIISTSSREQSLIDERVADVPMAPAQAPGPQPMAPSAPMSPGVAPAETPAPPVEYQQQPAPEAAPPLDAAPAAPATP